MMGENKLSRELLWVNAKSLLPRPKQYAYVNELDNVIREFEDPYGKKELEHINGFLEHAAVGVYPMKAKTRNLQYSMHLELFNYEDRIILADLVITESKWCRMALMEMNGVPLKCAFSNAHEYHDQFWTIIGIESIATCGVPTEKDEAV